MNFIKQNFIPFAFLGVIIGFLVFPVWSHFSIKNDIVSVNQKVEEVDNRVEQLSLVNEAPLGAPTRIRIGYPQVLWSNDLIPSTAFDPISLGSTSFPIDEFFTVTGSVSTNFEVSNTASVSRFSILDSATGVTMIDCNADNAAIGWDLATGRFFCGDDDSGTFDSTTVDNTTWSDNANATNVWTFDVSGTDHTLTFGSNYSLFSGSVSTSLNFEAVGYASASFFQGTAFGAIDCNDNAEGLQWSTATNTFTCRAWADADIPDAISVIGGTIGANSISGLQTTTGTLTFGDNGDRIDFDSSGWDVANSVMTGMTISTSNVTGVWTTTGNLTIGDNGDDVIIDSDTWNVSSLGAFTGVTGLVSTGVIDFGGADSFELPNAAAPTVDATGEFAFHTGSNSLDLYDGSVTRVKRNKECFGGTIEDPTSTNEKWVDWVGFDDPFTITDVYLVNASGSNSAGWNLKYGSPAAVRAGTATTVFTTQRNASASAAQIKYSSFANSTISDGDVLDVVITSASARIQKFTPKVCGYYYHP